MGSSLTYTQTLKNIVTYLQAETYSSVFFLVDENTKRDCFSLIENDIAFQYHVIEISAGEEFKNLQSAQNIWEQLTKLGADRNSLLVNFGGGVITDLGGFVAATFKRGMKFINVPTSLLAMVDAAIGGKTGIDFMNLKNQIGLFQEPVNVIIAPHFLKTLPQIELRSGIAEVIKYGLIQKNDILQKINIDLDENIINQCAEIKEEIVQKDPTEKGIRKILNFGHTLGHAIETYFLTKKKELQLLHGESIAIGMILALSLSHQTQDFSIKKANATAKTIASLFPYTEFKNDDITQIFHLLKHDKKNNKGQVNFILLKDIGIPVFDCQVVEKQILESFAFYKSIYLE